MDLNSATGSALIRYGSSDMGSIVACWHVCCHAFIGRHGDMVGVWTGSFLNLLQCHSFIDTIALPP